MPNNKYKLRYLTLFYKDLNEKVEYIAYEKLNPDAALRLIDNVEAAILERLPDAESFEQYHFQKIRAVRKSEDRMVLHSGTWTYQSHTWTR